MEAKFKIGDIVKVITEHPDGVDDINVLNDIGTITDIYYNEPYNEYDYTVSEIYCYEENQITLASEEEVRKVLSRLLKERTVDL